MTYMLMVLLCVGQAQYFAMMMMPVALLFTLYAVWTCLWRTHKINSEIIYKWEDPYGPIFLVSCLMLALSIEFFMTVRIVIDCFSVL